MPLIALPPPKYGLVVVAWANARLKEVCAADSASPSRPSSSPVPAPAAAVLRLPADGLGAPAAVLARVVEAVRGAPLEQLLSSNPNASPSLNMGIVLRAAKQELQRGALGRRRRKETPHENAASAAASAVLGGRTESASTKLPASVTANALVAGDAAST